MVRGGKVSVRVGGTFRADDSGGFYWRWLSQTIPVCCSLPRRERRQQLDESRTFSVSTPSVLPNCGWLLTTFQHIPFCTKPRGGNCSQGHTAFQVVLNCSEERTRKTFRTNSKVPLFICLALAGFTVRSLCKWLLSAYETCSAWFHLIGCNWTITVWGRSLFIPRQ